MHLAWPSLASAVAWIADSFPLVVTFQLLPAADKSWPKDVLLRLRSPLVLRLLRFVQPKRCCAVSGVADRDRLRQLFPRGLGQRRAESARAPAARRPGGTRDPLAPERGAAPVGGPDLQAKGLDRLARALATPELKALPWHWIIIGDGDERTGARSAAGRAPNYQTASPSPAPVLLHDVMPTAELVLAPSRWEGMPLVPMEAIVNGVPVVGSTIPSASRLFSKIPRSLLAEDEAEWPAALGALLRDDRARAELKAEQAELRAAVGPERTWREYELMYRALMER